MKGLTLIELMITLAVAAILLTIGVPNFQNAIATSRAAGLTNELAAALTFARSEAVTRGTIVTVCRTADPQTIIANDAVPPTGPACATDAATGWDDGWLVFVDGGVRGTVDGSDVRLKVGRPPEGSIVIDGSSPADNNSTNGNFDLYVSYLPSGVSRGSGLANGTLHLCSLPDKRRDIVISNTGRIRIERPADSACP